MISTGFGGLKVRPAIKPIERAVRMAAIFIRKAFPNFLLART